MRSHVNRICSSLIVDMPSSAAAALFTVLCFFIDSGREDRTQKSLKGALAWGWNAGKGAVVAAALEVEVFLECFKSLAFTNVCCCIY